MSAHGSKETWPTHLPDSILKHVTATGLHKDLNNLVESLSSEEWVVSWLHRLQSFRPPQIKPQHISTKDSYDVISTKGWLAKSEEAAIAWKLRGNDAFQKGQLQEALQFYNVVRLEELIDGTTTSKGAKMDTNRPLKFTPIR
jgi:hypothetical protein